MTSTGKVITSLDDQSEFPSPVLIETPNFNGSVLPLESDNSITLKLASKKMNQIIDKEKWLSNNQISLPLYEVYNEFRSIEGDLPIGIPKKYKNYIITKGFKYNEYNIFIYGVNFGEKRFMAITNKENTQIQHFLDFKNFNYAPKTLEGYRDLVFQSIDWAIIEKNILYVSHGHSTYAKSSFGKNSYISAINLTNYEIIWTTEPLTCGSSFILVNNSIICGYGFTNEPDYLFVVDKKTGKRNQTIDLEKGPSYIIQKENKIYVRTYDLDYEFYIK